jgi:hypothetical protein
MTPLLGATLPQNTGSGYVAAAYIVFFAIVLVYVAIMALRLSRVERGLRELHARTDRPQDGEPKPGSAAEERTPPAAAAPARGAQAREPETQAPDRERETV